MCQTALRDNWIELHEAQRAIEADEHLTIHFVINDERTLMNDHALNFKNSIQRIADYHGRDDLIHKTEWGAINFEAAETDVSSVLHMAKDLVSLPVELLPDSVLDQGRNTAEQFLKPLQQLETFSLTTAGDINHRRNELVNTLHRESENFSQHIGLWIPFLAYHRGDAEENIQKLNKAIASTQEKGEEFLRRLGEKNNEASQLIANIQSASAEAGVAVFTQDFSEESKQNDRVAKRWLFASSVLAVITLVILGCFYWQSLNLPETLDLAHMLPAFGCRVLIISVLFTATLWCGRMYKAMRNQALQNRHRALGLKTFRAFADATSDPQTRDAVLRETTHTIFSSTPTGLIADSTSNDVDPSIVQIAGGMLSNATSK